MTLVSEGGRGDRPAGFDQAAGSADAVECVRWQTGPLAKETDQAELADAGNSGKLIEADVALGPVAEVVVDPAERPVIGAAARALAADAWSRSARSERAATQRAARRARAKWRATRARCAAA